MNFDEYSFLRNIIFYIMTNKRRIQFTYLKYFWHSDEYIKTPFLPIFIKEVGIASAYIKSQEPEAYFRKKIIMLRLTKQ